MYRLFRPILFMLDAERSHDLALSTLAAISRSGPALRLIHTFGAARVPSIPCEFAGIRLPNPIGLAAGLDKDAAAFPALSALGFGWVEVGTVTPLPQPGNPKQRLFRITDDRAIINRMGFNSGGVGTFENNLRRLRANTRAVVGINIGKNAGTSMEHAAEDYTDSMDPLYALADYVAVNVSSPNTRSLRDLQHADKLGGFVETLKTRRDRLAAEQNRRVPLLIKIAPDLSDDEIRVVADTVCEQQLDGVIATNTTVQRPLGNHSTYAEGGGLSGRPLRALSTSVIGTLFRRLGDKVPIIGVGGIESAQDVVEKVTTGAQVVQIYSSLIFEGPGIIRRIMLDLERRMHSRGVRDWSAFAESLRT